MCLDKQCPTLIIRFLTIIYFMLDGASANNCGEPEQETIM